MSEHPYLMGATGPSKPLPPAIDATEALETAKASPLKWTIKVVEVNSEMVYDVLCGRKILKRGLDLLEAERYVEQEKADIDFVYFEDVDGYRIKRSPKKRWRSD